MSEKEGTSVRDGLNFDAGLGIWRDPRSGKNYCAKCLDLDKKCSPLMRGKGYYRCTVCREVYQDS
jgi:hypothetical protein